MKNRFITLVAALMLSGAPALLAAPAPQGACEAGCDAYYSNLVYQTTQNYADCQTAWGEAGVFMCGGIVALLGVQMLEWGTCKGMCNGAPWIMSAVREREVRFA